MSGDFLLIYICNFHVLSHLLLIYICKLHWNTNSLVQRDRWFLRGRRRFWTRRRPELWQRFHDKKIRPEWSLLPSDRCRSVPDNASRSKRPLSAREGYPHFTQKLSQLNPKTCTPGKMYHPKTVPTSPRNCHNLTQKLAPQNCPNFTRTSDSPFA